MRYQGSDISGTARVRDTVPQVRYSGTETAILSPSHIYLQIPLLQRIEKSLPFSSDFLQRTALRYSVRYLNKSQILKIPLNKYFAAHIGEISFL
jgi:hypothetical protein